ncbi:MAG: murein biosynthesis integral membrane protein MurJ [Albidovulum sp.]|nr:murein biosynthesis integral membrane protein MurJ [Albidovulum sp.]
MARGFLTVGSWTLVSRVLGLARDILFAAVLGAGPVAEAFLVAFSLPNMFRRLFAEGAFNMAFVPMFARKLENRDSPSEFGSDALSALSVALLILTLVAQLAMPLFVLGMASGFHDDGRFDLAVYFGRIVFPYVLFISLAALFSGVLNASGRFAAAAAAPVLLNIFFIGALGCASAFGWDAGLLLAWTVPIAGVAQFALVWRAAALTGLGIRFRLPRLTYDIKRLAMIAAPAALAGGIVQINLLVGRQVASFFDGAVAWLNYADRLYQLPLGVVGIAIGVVLLPDLSKKLASGDDAGGRYAFNRATEASLALALPAAVALAVVPVPIVSVLFQRGAFLAEDAAATSSALAIYSVGLPAFVLQKVLQPLYFAREDTKTPFRYAVAAMFINAAIAVGLAPVLGFVAAAWGTTIAGWAMAIMLWIGSRGMGRAARFDSALIRSFPRLVAAALATGAFLRAVAVIWESAFLQPEIRYAALAALVAFGIAFYTAMLVILRVYSLGYLLAVFGRRRT